MALLQIIKRHTAKIMENKIQRLDTDSITKLLIEFSWPAIAGMLIHSCYNIISRIFIGNTGSYDGMIGLAALTVCFPIMLIFFAIATMCGLGGSALYSIRLGEKNLKEAGKVLGTSIWLVSALTIISTVVAFINIEQFLKAFGASDAIMPYAKDYITVIISGSLFGGIGFTINAFTRADGSPSISMWTNIIGAAFNIIFAPIFLFALGWGMKGAGIAVIGGQLCTMIWVIAYFRGKRSTIKLTKEIFVFEASIVKKIIAMGMPPFAMQMINTLIMFTVNGALLKHGGEMAMSAMGIVMSIQTILIMPIIGISQGAQPIIGYNFGAKTFVRVAETVKQALIASTAIILFFYAIIRIFPDPIMSMFTQNQDLRTMGVRCMNILFLTFPFVGVQIIASCYFQSIGKIVHSIIITSTRQLIIFIPAVILLPMFMKFEGILWAAPFSDLASSLIAGACLYADIKNESKKHMKQKEDEE